MTMTLTLLIGSPVFESIIRPWNLAALFWGVFCCWASIDVVAGPIVTTMKERITILKKNSMALHRTSIRMKNFLFKLRSAHYRGRRTDAQCRGRIKLFAGSDQGSELAHELRYIFE